MVNFGWWPVPELRGRVGESSVPHDAETGWGDGKGNGQDRVCECGEALTNKWGKVVDGLKIKEKQFKLDFEFDGEPM